MCLSTKQPPTTALGYKSVNICVNHPQQLERSAAINHVEEVQASKGTSKEGAWETMHKSSSSQGKTTTNLGVYPITSKAALPSNL